MSLRERKEIQEVLRHPRKHWLIPAFIILFWLVMMGLLVYRERVAGLWHNETGPAQRTREPVETWLGVYAGSGRQVGFMHAETAPEVREGVEGTSVHMTTSLRLTLFDMVSEVLAVGSAWVPDEKGTTTFDARLQSGENRFGVEGKIADGLLDAKVHTAGETMPFRMPVAEGLIQPGVLSAPLGVAHMEPGGDYTVEAFNPLAMSPGPVQIQCLREEEVEAAGVRVPTKVLMMKAGSIPMKAWVTDEEELVRAEVLGFTLVKIRPEEAVLGEGQSDADLIELAGIRPTGASVWRGARRMAVRLTGVPEGISVPTDDTQRRDESGKYVIEMLSAPAAGSTTPGDTTEFAEYLKGDLLVQTGHPEIAHTGRMIVGDEKNPWQRALRVNDWVYVNVEKEMVASIPSALEVLRAKRGDCNEHTVLFAALARSLGVPTRIALGLVWSDEYGAFFYHAWPEVYVGRWIWMDPTLGQAVADATHIKLLTGSFEVWTQLAAYLGQIKIEVVDVE